MRNHIVVGLLVLLLQCLYAVNAMADEFHQPGEPEDYTLQNDGTTMDNPALTSLLVGGLDDGSRFNAVHIFALPVLPAGQVVDAADLFIAQPSMLGAPTFNLDLYGIGFATIKTPMIEYLESNTPDAGNVRIQDDIVTPALQTSTVIHGTNAAGNLALWAYLQGFYDANPGYGGGSYMFLRWNPDAQPALANNL